MNLNTKIAGTKTKADWLNLRVHLRENLENVNNVYWQQAFNDYFRNSLRTKYLNPLRSIINSNIKLGEGFIITTIQCVLIEFLASFREGKYVNGGFRLSMEDEDFYNHHSQNQIVNRQDTSRNLVVDFLNSQHPFSLYFNHQINNMNNDNYTLAELFYDNYRNYLIHLADTNNNCKIRAVYNRNINVIIRRRNNHETVYYRNAMQTAINTYLYNYYNEIVNAPTIELRLNFLLKMDDLCQTHNDI
ncbi:MAG: hypothetical protein NTW25_03805 [Candidatus Kapabacteria bacterium]|nr:hypothetical protein [Candidatus Kapabacteria bacterium]